MLEFSRWDLIRCPIKVNKTWVQESLIIPIFPVTLDFKWSTEELLLAERRVEIFWLCLEPSLQLWRSECQNTSKETCQIREGELLKIRQSVATTLDNLNGPPSLRGDTVQDLHTSTKVSRATLVYSYQYDKCQTLHSWWDHIHPTTVSH